ncbi:alpha/beta hydrolase [Streptomyces albogriseolus]|nr:alpha/beta hydrolase [Streptomyces albogriseolus]
MVAQVAALDHPDAFSALTLAGTRAVAPGPPDDDLPDHDQATMGGCSGTRCPTGATGRRSRTSPPPVRRSSATTPSPHARSPRASGTARPAPHPRSRWPTSWAWCSPGWTAHPAGASACPRSSSPRSSSTVAATGSSPVGNGEAIAREIPGARLLVLEEAATAIPDTAAGTVTEAMLTLG